MMNAGSTKDFFSCCRSLHSLIFKHASDYVNDNVDGKEGKSLLNEKIIKLNYAPKIISFFSVILFFQHQRNSRLVIF
jgi:hypothetical protein